MQIYKITNIINNKIYVGQDSQNRKNYFGSGLLIKRAITKYGIENFKKEILEECETIEKLNEKETFWIQSLSANDRNIGYNISPTYFGGDVYTNHPNKELYHQHIKEMFTHEIRKKISDGLKNSKKHQELMKSDIYRQKLRDAHKRKVLSGTYINSMKGKKHSEESKNKMSLALSKEKL